MKISANIALSAILALIAPSLAPAQNADPARGQALAERWCTACHVVAPDVPGGDAGPSFAALAPLVETEGDALRAWLAAPHDPMPDYNLTEQEIEDILAHIRSLAP